jgi:hypothetical protein
MIRIVVSILPVVLLGCVELQGQRISVYHDQEQDRLFLLLHYEGIHDSGSDSDGNGVEQIQQTARDGNFMLLDWYGYLGVEGMADIANDETKPAAERTLARCFVDRVTTFSLGTYRDVDGRIGAVQGIEVSPASELVDMIDRTIRGEDEGEGEDVPPTPDPKSTATDQHAWFRLEGHSLVLHCRVDDVTANKQEQQALAEWQEQARNAPQPAPLSIVQEGDWLTMTVGRKDTPSTVRITLRPEYEPSLEAVLEKSVPERIDEKLSPILLGDSTRIDEPEASWLRRLVEWGPPEENVRVVLAVAKGENEERRAEAFSWLEKWGSRLEEDKGLPAAPEPTGDPAVHLEAWEDWYRRIYHFPWRLDSEY